MEKQNSSCVIPGDIITYDILTRVPPESLVRFRCVCKTWSNLFVNNQLFIKLHSQWYDNKSYSSGFIDVEHEVDSISREYISSLVFINQDGKKKRIIPFKSTNTLFNTKVHILQSLNGVLLLCCDRNIFHKDHDYEVNFSSKYYVYNPITCRSTVIPVPIKGVKLGERRCFCLCYDRLIEKHKVVFCGTHNRKESSLRKIKILTVGDGLRNGGDPWRDIIVPDAFPLSDYDFYADRLYLFRPNIYLSRPGNPCNYLHWMVKPRDSDEYYLLCLDATREVYAKIKLPNEVSTLKLKCVINEVEGLLCLSHYIMETQQLKVWTLKKKDYSCDEDESIWSEISFNFSMEEERTGNCVVSSIEPSMILTVPKIKLIFAHCTYSFGSAPYYSDVCTYSYCSYDIELKQLEILHGPTTSHVSLHWHANTLANC